MSTIPGSMAVFSYRLWHLLEFGCFRFCDDFSSIVAVKSASQNFERNRAGNEVGGKKEFLLLLQGTLTLTLKIQSPPGDSAFKKCGWCKRQASRLSSNRHSQKLIEIQHTERYSSYLVVTDIWYIVCKDWKTVVISFQSLSCLRIHSKP